MIAGKQRCPRAVRFRAKIAPKHATRPLLFRCPAAELRPDNRGWRCTCEHSTPFSCSRAAVMGRRKAKARPEVKPLRQRSLTALFAAASAAKPATVPASTELPRRPASDGFSSCDSVQRRSHGRVPCPAAGTPAVHTEGRDSSPTSVLTDDSEGDVFVAPRSRPLVLRRVGQRTQRVSAPAPAPVPPPAHAGKRQWRAHTSRGRDPYDHTQEIHHSVAASPDGACLQRGRAGMPLRALLAHTRVLNPRT